MFRKFLFLKRKLILFSIKPLLYLQRNDVKPLKKKKKKKKKMQDTYMPEMPLLAIG